MWLDWMWWDAVPPIIDKKNAEKQAGLMVKVNSGKNDGQIEIAVLENVHLIMRSKGQVQGYHDTFHHIDCSTRTLNIAWRENTQ